LPRALAHAFIYHTDLPGFQNLEGLLSSQAVRPAMNCFVASGFKPCSLLRLAFNGIFAKWVPRRKPEGTKSGLFMHGHKMTVIIPSFSHMGQGFAELFLASFRWLPKKGMIEKD